MSNDAARIIKAIGGRRGGGNDFSGVQLATVKSISPFSMKVDDISFDVTAESVVVNAQLLSWYTQAAFPSASVSMQAVGSISGDTAISGTGRISGTGTMAETVDKPITIQADVVEVDSTPVSMISASIDVSGTMQASGRANLSGVLQSGDRVAVARVNMNCWAVLCKVVSV